MLNSLNNSFINSTKRVKIQLYILPILVIFLIILILQNSTKQVEDRTNYEILNLLDKRFEGTVLELVKQLESLAKENGIFIQKIEHLKDEIRVVSKSSSSDFDKFLIDIESLNNFTKVVALHIKTSDDSYISDLIIDFSKYFIKKDKLLDLRVSKELVKSYIKDEEKEQDIKIDFVNKKEFSINAIVGNFAFINGVWLEKDSYIDEYRLDFINRDFVLLKKDDETIKLEVNSLEYLKNKD